MKDADKQALEYKGHKIRLKKRLYLVCSEINTFTESA